jgi:hypothetical protein
MRTRKHLHECIETAEHDKLTKAQEAELDKRYQDHKTELANHLHRTKLWLWPRE